MATIHATLSCQSCILLQSLLPPKVIPQWETLVIQTCKASTSIKHSMTTPILSRKCFERTHCSHVIEVSSIIKVYPVYRWHLHMTGGMILYCDRSLWRTMCWPGVMTPNNQLLPDNGCWWWQCRKSELIHRPITDHGTHLENIHHLPARHICGSSTRRRSFNRIT